MRKIVGLSAKDYQGYQQVWNMGRAADAKKRQKINKLNRPST